MRKIYTFLTVHVVMRNIILEKFGCIDNHFFKFSNKTVIFAPELTIITITG